jgi:hypothetical protein
MEPKTTDVNTFLRRLSYLEPYEIAPTHKRLDGSCINLDELKDFKLLRKVADSQCQIIKKRSSENPDLLFNPSQCGSEKQERLYCDEWVSLLLKKISNQNIPALRWVLDFDGEEDPRSHVIIEIFDTSKNRWFLWDPWNKSFLKLNGEYVGVRDLFKNNSTLKEGNPKLIQYSDFNTYFSDLYTPIDCTDGTQSKKSTDYLKFIIDGLKNTYVSVEYPSTVKSRFNMVHLKQ